jgi:hypothetical protein
MTTKTSPVDNGVNTEALRRVGVAAVAQQRGIRLRSVSSTVEGTMRNEEGRPAPRRPADPTPDTGER